MKRLSCKSRKLILIILFGFRFVTMPVSFPMVRGAIAKVSLSTLDSNSDFNTEDTSESVYPAEGSYITQNLRQIGGGSRYNEEKSDTMAARRSSFILQSEAGPVQFSYNAASKGYSNLDETISQQNYNEEDVFRDGYVGTTPRIIGSKPSDWEEEDYYNDNERRDEENARNKDPQTPVDSVFSNAKNIWDIFIALNTAWNAVAQLQKEQAGHRDNEVNDDRLKRNSDYINNATQYAEHFPIERRHSAIASVPAHSSTATAVSEGRYIKGDPLKGYYDFVITEGSYKFWAAFQLATAVLIIYSTFAAIYYSKVNPLVGDYDYVDYLGGARSISDDSDFTDSDTTYNESGTPSDDSTSTTPGWLSGLPKDWLPQMGHTVKFILEAIDKLPQS